MSPIFKSEFKVFLGLMFVAGVVTLAFMNYAQSDQAPAAAETQPAVEQYQSDLTPDVATKLLLAQHLDISIAKIRSEVSLRQLGASESAAAEIILALEDRYGISLFENKGFDLNITVASLVHAVDHARHSQSVGM
jgi:acyl carrier protein